MDTPWEVPFWIGVQWWCGAFPLELAGMISIGVFACNTCKHVKCSAEFWDSQALMHHCCGHRPEKMNAATDVWKQNYQMSHTLWCMGQYAGSSHIQGLPKIFGSVSRIALPCRLFELFLLGAQVSVEWVLGVTRGGEGRAPAPWTPLPPPQKSLLSFQKEGGPLVRKGRPFRKKGNSPGFR